MAGSPRPPPCARSPHPSARGLGGSPGGFSQPGSCRGGGSGRARGCSPGPDLLCVPRWGPAPLGCCLRPAPGWARGSAGGWGEGATGGGRPARAGRAPREGRGRLLKARCQRGQPHHTQAFPSLQSPPGTMGTPASPGFRTGGFGGHPSSPAWGPAPCERLAPHQLMGCLLMRCWVLDWSCSAAGCPRFGGALLGVLEAVGVIAACCWGWILAR